MKRLFITTVLVVTTFLFSFNGLASLLDTVSTSAKILQLPQNQAEMTPTLIASTGLGSGGTQGNSGSKGSSGGTGATTNGNSWDG
jgi:hypothetical protein